MLAQLTVVWLALHAHAEPKYGTAKSICSHCNSTGHADTCDAYAQTHRLNAHLSKLRHFVKGEGPFASLCTGPTQQSCSVKHPYGRKSCARRVCAPEQLLGRFTPPDAAAAAGGAAATAELATVRANLTTGFEPKLTIGRYGFLGSDSSTSSSTTYSFAVRPARDTSSSRPVRSTGSTRATPGGSGTMPAGQGCWSSRRPARHASCQSIAPAPPGFTVQFVPLARHRGRPLMRAAWTPHSVAGATPGRHRRRRHSGAASRCPRLGDSVSHARR